MEESNNCKIYKPSSRKLSNDECKSFQVIKRSDKYDTSEPTLDTHWYNLKKELNENVRPNIINAQKLCFNK